jgi:hypothetical protein
MRPALARSQRPEAGTAVAAIPEVALQSAGLSNADHAVCRLGKQRREALALVAHLDPGCSPPERSAALG